ncbi:tRNA lysidine(34) synthetase TilS [uncultured Brachyspira sp.]|uniref:tRNA lysidine(34) synthetase TilS n=5 Tax=uncultured Brachyspira sp. TaxID=221953 RepID=UPI0025D9B143|nr:tRNA lysidine(34) synthetase TilS [uncultured Brachyspira sp.]
MIEETQKFLISNIDDIKNKTLALAYSGGIDSHIMLNILYRLKEKLSFNLIMLHVNYNLRGEDSINDELFARDTANKYNIEIYIKEIPPNSYNKKNIQLEARNDRYNFFKELYNKKIYDYLIIAHNKDDLAETIIYRMIKGAGADIYKSLRKKKGYILRPILNFYRKDIEVYAEKNKLSYREDYSNKKNYYARNKIRNLIIPMLEEINTKSKDNIILFSKRIYKETSFLRKKVSKLYKKNISDNNKSLNIKEIKNINTIFAKKIIIKFLAKNNIDITEKRVIEILKIIKSNKPNIKLRLDNFYLIKEYNFININPLTILEENTNIYLKIKNDGIYDFFNRKIEIKTILNKNINYKDKLYIKYEFPIIIRNKKDGDFLNAYPYGNKKLLRKIFIDLKISLYNRSKIPIIASENDDILALYLHPYGLNRISNNAAVNEDDKYILEINIY